MFRVEFGGPWPSHLNLWDRAKWQTRLGDSVTQIGGWALGWMLVAESPVRKVESRMWRETRARLIRGCSVANPTPKQFALPSGHRVLGKLVELDLYPSSRS